MLQSLFGKSEKETRDEMQNRHNIAQECVASWSSEDLYNCFSRVTERIHSIENREALTKLGWTQFEDIEHEIVKIFATKKTEDANLPV
tara:strand:+ start:412 stop:675 length:264 start_codon:yes stop_codon:yes gene_type:complete